VLDPVSQHDLQPSNWLHGVTLAAMVLVAYRFDKGTQAERPRLSICCCSTSPPLCTAHSLMAYAGAKDVGDVGYMPRCMYPAQHTWRTRGLRT
jgi:hypothetical protein